MFTVCKSYHYHLVQLANFNTAGVAHNDGIWLTHEFDNHFAFKVKAEQGVEVALASVPHLTQEQAILLCIGCVTNQKTIIWDMSNLEDLCQEDTPNILSKDEFRWFWISYSAGYLQFGKGRLAGVDHVMGCHLPVKYRFHGLSLATEYYASGYWQISHIGEGNSSKT